MRWGVLPERTHGEMGCCFLEEMHELGCVP
jgi:hypothetical protein